MLYSTNPGRSSILYINSPTSIYINSPTKHYSNSPISLYINSPTSLYINSLNYFKLIELKMSD